MGRFWLKLKARFSTATGVILIEDGRVRVVRGSLSRGVLGEFSELAARYGIREGLITVSRSPDGPVLRFTGPFDPSARQRFRNVWFAQPERKMTRV